jgi:hypothetical protein
MPTNSVWQGKTGINLIIEVFVQERPAQGNAQKCKQNKGRQHRVIIDFAMIN